MVVVAVVSGLVSGARSCAQRSRIRKAPDLGGERAGFGDAVAERDEVGLVLLLFGLSDERVGWAE